MSYFLASIKRLMIGVKSSWTECFEDVDVSKQVVKVLMQRGAQEVVVIPGELKNATTREFEFVIEPSALGEGGIYNYQYVVFETHTPISILCSSIVAVEALLGTGDARSLNEKILASIENTLLNNAGQMCGEITVPKTGVNLKYRSLDELHKLRMQYQAIVNEEHRLKTGMKKSKMIGTRM